jgi:hypothetical protein
MYVAAGTDLMRDTQDDLIRKAKATLRRQLCIQQTFAQGRAGIFQDIESPNQVTQQFGIPAGVNAANLQQQTLDSRASAFLYGSGTTGGEQVNLDSPEVFPVNRGGGCVPTQQQMPQPKYKKITPSFPRRAPHIVQTKNGPMYIKGKQSTIVPSSQLGLSGYAPPWGNAFVEPSQGEMGTGGGVLNWIQSNPWLSLAIAGAGVLVATQAKRGRR